MAAKGIPYADDPRKLEPALLVISAIYSDARSLQGALDRLSQIAGAIQPADEETIFSWTQYYAKEMGDNLHRRFFYGERLVPRELLAEVKRATIRIEQSLADDRGVRRVNLDPGLLTLGNFVLASTKNNSHRIYLQDGIFAEVTLRYVHHQFEPYQCTYPDYASPEIRQLLKELRRQYMDTLRGAPVLLDPKLLREENSK